MHRSRCLGWTSEDTPKEAKLHGRQCPLHASSEFEFPRLLLRRVPNAVIGYFSSPQPRGKSNAQHRGGLPAPQPNTKIIAKALAGRKGGKKFKTRRNEITVRTKSRQICRGKAGASEMHPYLGGAAIFNGLSRNRARRKYQAWSLPINSQGAFLARSPPRKRTP